MSIRIGLGYDVHSFKKGRKLILGGVEIESSVGLDGHSDADVLLHAITDALLGALSLGDIGTHFPDTDADFKNADSKELLKEAYSLVVKEGYSIINLDATVVAEQPRLNPYISQVQQSIADVLKTSVKNVSVKATTSEKMGFVGRGEGMAVHAVVLVQKQ